MKPLHSFTRKDQIPAHMLTDMFKANLWALMTDLDTELQDVRVSSLLFDPEPVGDTYDMRSPIQYGDSTYWTTWYWEHWRLQEWINSGSPEVNYSLIKYGPFKEGSR